MPVKTKVEKLRERIAALTTEIEQISGDKKFVRERARLQEAFDITEKQNDEAYSNFCRVELDLEVELGFKQRTPVEVDDEERECSEWSKAFVAAIERECGLSYKDRMQALHDNQRFGDPFREAMSGIMNRAVHADKRYVDASTAFSKISKARTEARSKLWSHTHRLDNLEGNKRTAERDLQDAERQSQERKEARAAVKEGGAYAKQKQRGLAARRVLDKLADGTVPFAWGGAK